MISRLLKLNPTHPPATRPEAISAGINQEGGSFTGPTWGGVTEQPEPVQAEAERTNTSDGPERTAVTSHMKGSDKRSRR